MSKFCFSALDLTFAMRKKTVSLIPLKNPSWRALLGVFLSAFGVLWVFIEPLQIFGLGDWLATLGGTGYVALLVASTLCVAAWYYAYLRIQKGRFHTIRVQVLSVTEGARVDFFVPRDMLMSVFVEKVLDNSLGAFSDSTIDKFKWRYKPELHREDDEEVLPLEKTFSQANVLAGTSLVLHGKPVWHGGGLMY